MTWLVTGGAGYIGAHVVRALTEAGLDTVVLDDLSSGHEEFVPESVPFVRGSILDGELVLGTLAKYAVTGVIHVAGYKYAGVSVQRPLHTYEQNVTGTAVLLAAMASAGVDRIVFSSTGAVYGNADSKALPEDFPCAPINSSLIFASFSVSLAAILVKRSFNSTSLLCSARACAQYIAR